MKDDLRAELEANPLALHADLALKLNLHRSTISRYAAQMGFANHLEKKMLRQGDKIDILRRRLDEDPTRPFSALAAELGLNERKVAYWAQKHTGKPRRKFSTKTDHARWVQQFERGMSLARIAQMSGFHADTISRVLRARGIETNPNKNEVAEQALSIVAAEGVTIAVAASRVGTTPEQVRSYKSRKKQEQQDADRHVDHTYDDIEFKREQQTAGGQHAAGVALVGPPDLRTPQGRPHRSRLAGTDASEGQASRQRLRRHG
jgi:AraC-like DNA-binding protein